MKTNKHVLTAAVIAAIGAGVCVNSASAAVVADGTYNLVINTTPTFTTSSGGTAYKFGKDGAWNSAFSLNFGGLPNNSCAMTDNNISVASNGGPRGSAIGGDGWAGILGISVTGGTFSLNGVPGMGGTIDQSSGAMTLTPTGRLAAASGFPAWYDLRFNVDNCTLTSTGCINNGNTLWSSFSTTSATSSGGGGGPITIHGAALAAQGDINADGKTDYTAILVSAGQWGSDWASIFGGGYFEMWNIQLLSTASPHSGFNVDTIPLTPFGDIAQYAPVPIPAAAWLFGSGLFGLAGVARRRRK